MKAAWSKVVWTVGLTGLSAAALADQPKHAPPQEPAGFVTGAVIGGFAAGPIGAVVGAGLGTWLGNRVHRAGEAAKAEAQVAALKGDREALELKAASLEGTKSDLEETNRALTARLGPWPGDRASGGGGERRLCGGAQRPRRRRGAACQLRCSAAVSAGAARGRLRRTGAYRPRCVGPSFRVAGNPQHPSNK